MSNIDFLAIGDLVVDEFIKLNKAHTHENIYYDGKELCISFGDKVPFESSESVYAVGNSPNASVAAARLGLNSALLACVGDDDNGKKCLDSLKKDNVQTEYIGVDKEHPTNHHFVLLFGAERTILVKHSDFKYSIPKDLPQPKWIYLSSLAESSLEFHEEIADYLKSHPETKLAFQPGTFQMKLGAEKLRSLYNLTEIFFCNKEEAQRILDTEENDIKKLLGMMHALGPKITVITDGPAGAYAYDGSKYYSVPMYPDIAPPTDRTGAGDSFSSTVTIALSLGMTLSDALLWGPINSMSVVQYIGAQRGLLSREKLEEFLRNAPDNYKVKEI